MAKAGLLFVGTDDGLVLFSNPGAVGRWLRVGHELRGEQVRSVWLAPDNPLLAVAAGGGLWRSDDGGQSWRQGGAIEAVALAGGASDRPLYLADGSGALYRSDDAGASWSSIRPPAVGSFAAPQALAVRSDGRLFIAAGAVWTSGDGGESWEAYGAGAPESVQAIVAASGSDALYAIAGGALWRCEGAGASWRAAAAAPAGPIGLEALPGREEALLVASGAGVARSVDGGTSWGRRR